MNKKQEARENMLGGLSNYIGTDSALIVTKSVCDELEGDNKGYGWNHDAMSDLVVDTASRYYDDPDEAENFVADLMYYIEEYYKELNKERKNDLMNAQLISSLVEKVVGIYMKEDYEYAVKTIKSGSNPNRAYKTVEEEIEFLKSANLIPANMTEKEVQVAAGNILDSFDRIEHRIYEEHVARPVIERAQEMVFEFTDKFKSNFTEDEAKILLSVIADKTKRNPDDIGYRAWEVKDLEEPGILPSEDEEDEEEYGIYPEYTANEVLEEVLNDQLACLWFSGEDLWK